MREKQVETACVKYAKSKGIVSRKLRYVGVSGAPDRLFLGDGIMWFVEFKAPGKKARPKQELEASIIRKAGGQVDTIDDLLTFKSILHVKMDIIDTKVNCVLTN